MTVKFWNVRSGEFELSLSTQPSVVGRAGAGAAVELLGDERLSRRHARLWANGSDVWYEDLGSANGSWLYGERLTTATRLVEGVPIVLGETSVVLAGAAESIAPRETGPILVDDMQVLLRREAHTQGLVESMLASGRAATYISEFYAFVAVLLRSTSRDLMSLAMLRVYEVVPSARRIALVAWPPEPDGSFRHLLPPEELEKKGGNPGPISTSLSRFAVERREALLLSDLSRPPDLQVGKSVDELKIRSAVYVPVMAQNEVLGVLCVDTPEASRPFSRQDFQFICAVGGLLGSAMAAESLREKAQRSQMEINRSDSRRESLMAFFKIASHDLKNPLAAIHLSASVLPKIRDPAMLQEVIQVIRSAGNRARELVSAYLEVAAMETGLTMQANLQDIDLGRLVDEEISFIKKTRDDSSMMEFENHVGQRTIRADRQKVRQVLTNLLSNAVKYSPSGVRVEVSAKTNGTDVEIRVRDHGVGISDADRDKLFLQFQRVGDLSMAKGTGLGLWLSASLVQAHGGHTWVDRTEGAGSTFAFSLPQPSS